VADALQQFREADERNRALTASDVGVEIVNELVKSYGFHYDQKSGSVDWSVDNIRGAFKESPFWTTLDWLTVAVPVTKWGVAAARVGTGAKVLGKTGGLARAAYVAGEYGDPSTFRALRAGARAYLHQPKAATQWGRYFESAMGKTLDVDMARRHMDKLDDASRLVVAKGIASQLHRDRKVYEAAVQSQGQQLFEAMGRFGDEARVTALGALKTKADDTAHGALMAKLSPRERAITEATGGYRDFVHTELATAMNWGEDFTTAGKGQYWPNVYKQFYEPGLLDPDDAVAASRFGGTKEAQKRLMGRTVEGKTLDEWQAGVAKFNEETGLNLEAIIDPRAGISELAKVASIPAAYRYVESLAKTPLVKRVDELDDAAKAAWPTLGSLLPGKDPSGVFKSSGVKAAKDALSAARKAGDDALIDDAMESVSKALDKELFKGPYKHIPDEWKNLRVDPLVSDELMESMKLAQIETHPIFKPVVALTQFFQASKTAYNPGTHVRNFISNTVFNSASTGRLDLVPASGIKTLRAAMKGDKQAMALLQEARGLGVVGHTFDKEIIADLVKAYGDADKADDILGGMVTKVWPKVDKLRQKALRTYGYEDDVWKLHAYIKNRAKFTKTLVDPDLAKSRAALEVVKYFPMYGEVNEFTKAVRQYVPFASFTMESMRVMKNMMTFKPWWAMGWAHSAEWATQTAAAAAGVSQEQLESARGALPEYTKGKKLLLLPWRDGEGSLQFFDLSYILPLADLAGEWDKMEGNFLGIPPRLSPMSGFGLTQNPVVSTAIASTLGMDPFTQQPIDPDVTERVTGVPMEGATRKTVGVLEHVAKTLLPPWVPPGYAGVNLIEAATGEVNPKTGEPYEPDFAKTFLANVVGMRSISPSETGARSRAYKQRELATEEKKNAWARMDHALANGNTARARAERERLIKLYGSEAKFREAAKRRASGLDRRSLSKADAEKARESAASAGGRLLPQDQKRKFLSGLSQLREKTEEVPALR
jgi:hypothetical protein